MATPGDLALAAGLLIFHVDNGDVDGIGGDIDPEQAAVHLDLLRRFNAVGAELGVGDVLGLTVDRPPHSLAVSGGRALVVRYFDDVSAAKLQKVSEQLATDAWDALLGSFEGELDADDDFDEKTSPGVTIELHDGRDTVLAGHIETLAVSELLQYMQGAHRTGVLRFFADDGSTAELHLRQGRLIGAHAPSVPSLGELLIKKGRVTSGLLKKARERKAGDEHIELSVGPLLLDLQVIDLECFRDALKEQVCNVLRHLLRWEQGEFRLDRDVADFPEQYLELALDPQTALITVFGGVFD